MTRRIRSRFPLTAASTAALVVLTAPGQAERPLLAGELPPELDGVGIVERLDEAIPTDLSFTNDQGQKITVADLLEPGKPVILTLNYYRCPMLCTLTLNGLVDSLEQIDWTAGEEFQIVTVSIAPDETPDLAELKKRAYLSQYDRPSVAAGWHFLTGEQPEIEALAKAVGFGYRYDERSGEYAHTSSIMFLTPDGRISRYMNDVQFAPRDVRLALVEASQGAIGSPMDKFLLFMCYHYDPDAGNYAPSAVKIMRLGGGVTLLAIVIGFFVLQRRGSHRSGRGDLALGGLHS